MAYQPSNKETIKKQNKNKVKRKKVSYQDLLSAMELVAGIHLDQFKQGFCSYQIMLIPIRVWEDVKTFLVY